MAGGGRIGDPRSRPGPRATVTDLHIRILRQVARQSKRELSGYETVEPAGDDASTARRDYLERTAERTRARVVDAEQRRSRRPHGQCDPRHQTTSASRSAESLL